VGIIRNTALHCANFIKPLISRAFLLTGLAMAGAGGIKEQHDLMVSANSHSIAQTRSLQQAVT
jgi:hypothetical protein